MESQDQSDIFYTTRVLGNRALVNKGLRRKTGVFGPSTTELRLDLHGLLVSIDAMGCQKEIASMIVERGGDYLLTVKDNQPNLLADIQASLGQAFDSDDARLDHWETEDKGHGRTERRCYTVLPDPTGIRGQVAWQDLKVIGMCTSERTVQGKVMFMGSNLRATHNLARNVANSIKQSSLPEPSVAALTQSGKG